MRRNIMKIISVNLKLFDRWIQSLEGGEKTETCATIYFSIVLHFERLLLLINSNISLKIRFEYDLNLP